MEKYVMLAQMQTALTAFGQKLRKWVEQQEFMKNPATDGQNGQVLSTDGKGTKFWKSVETAGAANEALSAAKKYTDEKIEDVGAGVDREAVAEIVQEKIDKAKENGEFDYELTEEEKNEIAKQAADMVDVPGVDLTGYATEQFVKDGYQPKGNYLTEHQSLAGYAKTSDIPTKPEDIGAQPAGNYALKTEIPAVPVKSVNGKTGAVSLSAADVNARPDNWMPTAEEVGALPSTYTPPNQTAEQVGADPKGTAASAVGSHNTNTDAHNDLRLELKAINDRLNAFFDSDNQTLDELSEIVAYITNNKSLIDNITTSKINVADIINNLTTNVANKPLSAAQGVALKALIDAVSTSLTNYQPKGNYALQSEIPDISGKLDSSALPIAINTALAQAKASGEFDGKDGNTPVKGTDYWTAADQEAIVQQVIANTGIDVIPTYVVSEAEAVLNRVLSAQGNRTFTLAAITDMHYGSGGNTDGVKHASQALGYIADRMKLDAMAVLGDYTDLYASSDFASGLADMQAVNSLLSGVDADMLTLCGNHDYNAAEIRKVMRTILGKSDDVVWGSRNGGYYYRDFSDYKLRVIALNTSETGSGNIYCSAEQYSWFVSALDMSAKEDAAKWQILILSHHPLDWYEGVGDGVYRFGHILDSYVNGKSWSGGGVSCNFSGKNAARIVCNVHGHIHNLKVDKIHVGNPDQTSTVIDVYRMCMPESCFNRPQSYGGVWNTETTYSKTANTANDTSFTVLCIDLDTYTVNAVCYGAGEDRSVVYYDPSAPKYDNKLKSATDSSGNPYRGTNGEIGYKTGYRLNSSGDEAQNADYCVTGFIPLEDYDYVYLKNMNFIVGNTTDQPNTRLAIYDSSFKKLRVSLTGELSASIYTDRLDENGGTVETGDAIGRFRYVDADGKYYIRFSTKKIDDTSVVTINEPIV